MPAPDGSTAINPRTSGRPKTAQRATRPGTPSSPVRPAAPNRANPPTTPILWADNQTRRQAIRIERIAAHDLVLVRVKDRLIYGEVLEITDGTVRMRPLCPGAGWHRATARQVVGHWRKTGRRQPPQPSQPPAQLPSAQQTLLPHAGP